MFITVVTRGKNKGLQGPVWHKKDPQANIPVTVLKKPPRVNLQPILHPHEWLNSDVMDLAMSYLAEEAGNDIEGFQSTVVFGAIKTGGLVGTPTKKFIQCLHARGYCNIFCRDNEVVLYDSARQKPDKDLEKILSWLLRTDPKHFSHHA